MSRARSFVHEWIDLVERSGLLVSEPVLHRFFLGGPEHVEPRRQRVLLSAWERFQVDPSDGLRQSAWLDAVFFGLLEWPEDRLARGARLPPQASIHLPELDQNLRPSAVLTGEGDRFLLAVWRIAADQKLDRVERTEGSWRATPAAKLERWLRQSGTPFGLLTSGAAFRLVHVPPGLPASWIEFPASTFFEEKSVLDGFWTLLRAARFFGPAEHRLEHFAAESQKAQAELTESLGEQVRRAVEELILALDRADRGSREHPLDIGAGGRIFLGHHPDEIYKAAVYVVMRLVFILFAEEKSLLPHGNVFFDEGYGLSRLLYLLEEEKRTRPETFDQEADAWPRLLALFRLIFLGSPHPDLPLPVYGGDLFSPADFPALAALESKALRIPNRSIYAILRALTFGEAKVGKEKIAQRYSYRNLDVEHIGYLYEGLLDHHAARAGREPLVKLANGTEVATRLSELEALDGERLVSFLAERGVAGGDRGRIETWLAEPPVAAVAEIDRLPEDVARRCRPYAGVVQTDEVVLPGRLYLTTSSSRRATGTHYTPIQYTRAMVTETLEPLVYVGEHGKLEEPRRLRSPREILDLKVCDPAMGSGAFLVQGIRYLGDKLADSWQAERERHGEGVALYLPYAEPGTAREDRIPLPEERTDAELWAMRLVAERCIYGVDKNPLAVEMAKLSIWLVTLDQKKPFSFVNHALKPGDSLLGISSLGQLRSFNLSGEGEQLGLLEERIAQGVQRAVLLRQQIGNLAVVTSAHVVQKEKLLAEADREVRSLWALADLLISTITRFERPTEEEAARIELLARVSYLLDSTEELEDLARRERGEQRPFHWPLAFPEVWDRCHGFDAFLSNPPFLGGKRICLVYGDEYNGALKILTAKSRGAADLCAYFFRRADYLLHMNGCAGLMATNTIAEADTREVGLDVICESGSEIFAASPGIPWPGKANVDISIVHWTKGRWQGPRRLGNEECTWINSRLQRGISPRGKPYQLAKRRDASSAGTSLLGIGFTIPRETAEEWISRDPRYAEVLQPYFNAKDLSTTIDFKPLRYVINFGHRNEEDARTYPLAFQRVEKEVKSGREKLTRQIHEPDYWKHWDKREDLYQAIRVLDRVLACPLVTKHLPFTFLPPGWVYSKELAVFSTRRATDFVLLQSQIHAIWAQHNSSTHQSRLRYSISDAYRTFPSITAEDEHLEFIGEELHRVRLNCMAEMKVGLTQLYNCFNDPREQGNITAELREWTVKADYAVARSFGWQDLDLEHGFYEIDHLPKDDRIRYSFSEMARNKTLDRIYQLNQDEHDRDVAQGLRSERKLRQAKAKTPYLTSIELLQLDLSLGAISTALVAEQREPQSASETNKGLSQHASALLTWFRTTTDWRSRAEALDALKFATPEWNQAIQELLEAGLVERTGEKRGTRYRAKL